MDQKDNRFDNGKLGSLLNKYPNLYADISARYGETAFIEIPEKAKFTVNFSPPFLFP